MPSGEAAARAAVRDEYERVLRSQEEARVSKIRENVGGVPPNVPSPVAAAALKRIVSTQANIQRGNWSDRSSRPVVTGKPPRVKLSPHKPPPPGLSWVRVRTNLRCPEGIADPTHYVPYLGDTDAMLKSSNTLYRDLTDANVDDNDDTLSDSGRVDYSDVEDMESSLALRPGQRVLAFGRERAAKRVTIRNLVGIAGIVEKVAEFIASELGITEENVAAYFSNAETRSRQWDKYDSEQEFKADCKSELVAAARAEIVDPVGVELASDSLTVLFCRQCYSFDCMQHGLDTSKPRGDCHDASRIAVLSGSDRKAVYDRCNSINPNRCWALASQKLKDSAISGDERNELAPSAKALVGTFRQTFGDDPCRISEMIRISDYVASGALSCLDVGAYIASLPALAPLKRPRHGGAPSKKSKKVGGGSVPNKEINAMHSGMRLDFTPCNHPGPCTTKNCSCAKTGVNCEKYCGCNQVRVSGDSRSNPDGLCPRSFRGCNCKSAAACQTNQCVCVSHRRECDPDLCRNCGAGNAPGEPRGCCNAGLRLGLRYRTVVGRSSVHGWGVYPVVEIPKNVLVGEYLGELITQEEAERRGRVYDELQYSFLFNITQNYAIDSTRMGSKLKYCNHSSEPNCEPRLMRVGGDVRVGIYSKRLIKAFEELFFDYGYGKTGPDWANTSASKIKQLPTGSNDKPVSDVYNVVEDADFEENDDDDDVDDSGLLANCANS